MEGTTQRFCEHCDKALTYIPDIGWECLNGPCPSREISRQRAKKAVEEMKKIDCKKIMTGWISVEDRLPEVVVDVLIAVDLDDDGCLIIDKGFLNEQWMYSFLCFHCGKQTAISVDGKVTHWMPLPSPPSVDEQ